METEYINGWEEGTFFLIPTIACEIGEDSVEILAAAFFWVWIITIDKK